MALTEKNASPINLKRAESFKNFGLSTLDFLLAQPHFEGKSMDPVGGTCVLCGQQHLLWLYSIFFPKPDIASALGSILKGISRTEEVTCNPVGSVCIQEALDALPESAEKLAALKRWKTELEKEKAAKKIQAIENALKKLGIVSTEDAIKRIDALTNEQRNSLNWYERKALASFSSRIRSTRLSYVKQWQSPKAANLFASVLKKAEGFVPVVEFGSEVDLGQHGDPEDGHAHPVENLGSDGWPVKDTSKGEQLTMPKTPEEVAKAAKKAEIESLLERGREVFRDKAKLGHLDKYGQGALADIGKKVKSYGSFASDNQKRYFIKLLMTAETGSAPAKPETVGAEDAEGAKVGAQPGEPGFISASGIAGARY